MKIIKKTESVEPCTESGWYAWDYELEREMGPEDIEALAALGGSFLYLKQLKEPFYILAVRLVENTGTFLVRHLTGIGEE